MACDTNRQPEAQAAQLTALQRLERALATGGASVVIGSQGAIAFRGWKEADRGGLSDLCAYRKLAASNSAELRRAVARAEAMSGRKLDPRAVASGTHSHDGGGSWHHGH